MTCSSRDVSYSSTSEAVAACDSDCLGVEGSGCGGGVVALASPRSCTGVTCNADSVFAGTTNANRRGVGQKFQGKCEYFDISKICDSMY